VIVLEQARAVRLELGRRGILDTAEEAIEKLLPQILKRMREPLRCLVQKSTTEASE
jgi:hypothetical protein